ncbi:MAG: DUF3800 domain-containing protein [Acidobacteria bacterium]|nr:DUF3800 domain-containing protein [Acidobacteriota bacterium]MYG27547.1 DUF3800 domain-containing protein [Boseongicola sp. SB0677_bin_26]
MIVAGYYIDDAGTPGTDSGSVFLDESRKSWCAVIIPERAARALAPAVDVFLRGVKQDYGADELHSADIYGGRDVWQDVSVANRMQVFDLMTGLFETFRLPVIFQTINEWTFADHPAFFAEVRAKRGQFWDVRNIAHFGLLVTCHHLATSFDHLKKEYPSDFPRPLPAYVDEGLAKPGAEVLLPNWERAIRDRRLTFRRSVDTPGLQLADFAAFSIARTQWIAARQREGTPIKPADEHIMAISGKFNHFNLDRVAIDPSNFSRETYELFLRRDRAAKGLTEFPSSDR